MSAPRLDGIGMGMKDGPADDKRRIAERHSFAGAEVYIYRRWRQVLDTGPRERFNLRLKDVSRSGICGLTDAPLLIGDVVFVQFETTLMLAAHVAWFRHALIGLELVEVIPEARMERLRMNHEAGQLWSPAMRARATAELTEQKRDGRAARAGR